MDTNKNFIENLKRQFKSVSDNGYKKIFIENLKRQFVSIFDNGKKYIVFYKINFLNNNN